MKNHAKAVLNFEKRHISKYAFEIATRYFSQFVNNDFNPFLSHFELPKCVKKFLSEAEVTTVADLSTLTYGELWACPHFNEDVLVKLFCFMESFYLSCGQIKLRERGVYLAFQKRLRDVIDDAMSDEDNCYDYDTNDESYDLLNFGLASCLLGAIDKSCTIQSEEKEILKIVYFGDTDEIEAADCLGIKPSRFKTKLKSGYSSLSKMVCFTTPDWESEEYIVRLFRGFREFRFTDLLKFMYFLRKNDLLLYDLLTDGLDKILKHKLKILLKTHKKIR